jgi:hypothetical protein
MIDLAAQGRGLNATSSWQTEKCIICLTLNGTPDRLHHSQQSASIERLWICDRIGD